MRTSCSFACLPAEPREKDTLNGSLHIQSKYALGRVSSVLSKLSGSPAVGERESQHHSNVSQSDFFPISTEEEFFSNRGSYVVILFVTRKVGSEGNFCIGPAIGC